MEKKIIIFFLAFLLTILSAHANSHCLEVRGYQGTNTIYAESKKNKAHIRLPKRVYYSVLNSGLESLQIRVKGSNKKAKRLSAKSLNAHLNNRNLILTLPKNLLEKKGLYSLLIDTSDDSASGSFNFIPNIHVVNNNNGLEVESVVEVNNQSVKDSGEGLVVSDTSEEVNEVQDLTSNGLEVSF